MFEDIDTTLEKILLQSASPIKIADAAISFITPDKNFQPEKATVDLFLYDVRENRELRDATPIVERVGSQYVRKAPPIRVECSYIVTAWSKKEKEQKVIEEHRLLGDALGWLSRFPVIPGDLLRGTLQNNQSYPLPTLVAQLDPNKNAGEFWIALAIAPRPAFYVSVTVSVDLAVQETGPMVLTHMTHASPDAAANADRLVQIAGHVFDNAGKPITGAIVDLSGEGQRAISTDEGRYTFTQIATGTHQLRVAAAGFKVATPTIEIPDFPDRYDVTLAPL